MSNLRPAIINVFIRKSFGDPSNFTYNFPGSRQSLTVKGLSVSKQFTSKSASGQIRMCGVVIFEGQKEAREGGGAQINETFYPPAV